jgi:phage/plasmid-like protein (TIGR03299 family)
MFSVREKPWHFTLTGDRTTILQDYPETFAEARRLGGLAWDLAAKEAWIKNLDDATFDQQIARVMLDASWDTLSTTERVKAIRSVVDGADGAFTADPLFTRYTRSDTGASLSYMMPSWNPIRIGDIEPIIEALFAAAGKKVRLLIETCGSLDEGRALWVLLKLDEPLEFTRDKSYTFPYLALTCRHDGTASLSAILTLIRIVCMNTFRAAEAAGKKSGAMHSFTHRTKWQNQIADAAVARDGGTQQDKNQPASRGAAP